ncbi:MAG: HD domain-containing protein [Betaproteobacteria bacterium]|nr:HD domain-containing protein [Betaproteobacteria bacterium]
MYALSDALDLVGIDDVAHGKRVGIMAGACADALGLAGPDRNFVFDLGLLHDIGVSSTSTHYHLVTEFDWESSQRHCDVGYELLRCFGPLAAMADPVHYHHTHWERLARRSDISPVVAEQANLIYLVDRVDALASPYYGSGAVLMHAAEIRQKIGDKGGSYFSPKLVEAFLSASATEAFWLQLEPRGIQAALQDMLARSNPYRASMEELKQLARIFSRIVDAKSPFTVEHSLGVARLSRYIGERMGLDAATCDKLEIAGLLHDLGKLRVPDEVLEKPGALDEREQQIIHVHSFETFQILHRIRGFEDITLWAAYHHEAPDGSGYPFHLQGAAMPLEARILRVSDIFQAMVQDRPYRSGLSADAVLSFLNELAAAGRVDAEVTQVVTADMPAAMLAARPPASPDNPS